MKIVKLLLTSIVAFATCLFATSVASADVITPGGNAFGQGTASFGSLPQATFGGNGIPNNAVQIVQTNGLTLGLTATQRYGNALVTNDGAGTFFANAGGDVLNGAPTLATWNFDFYVSGISSGVTTKLFYDNNPAAGNNVTSFYSGYNLNYQDSQNLGFGAFNGGTFNPSANGEYGFSLVAYNSNMAVVAVDSILVKVGSSSSVPDGGTTASMLGIGLTAMGLMSFRKKVC